VVLWSEID